MDGEIVEKPEPKIEQATNEVMATLDRKKLPLIPNRRTMHLMAKAAVTVYEAAVENMKCVLIGKAAMPTDDFTVVFDALKAILKKYEKRCVIDLDTDTEYFLNSKKRGQQNKPIFFAGVGINKISVSFYLMAVHSSPEMQSSLSTELRKRLHGKSCFRFKRHEPELFKELIALTKRAVEKRDSE